MPRRLPYLLLPSLLSACAGGDPAAPPDGGVIVDPSGWPVAPELGTVTVTPNRDSVVLEVPAVAGAEDYRVFAYDDSVEISANPDGTEQVDGATIFCAGRAQHAADITKVDNEVLRKIEVAGVTATTTFIVEALDRECPFVGMISTRDVEINAGGEARNSFGVDESFPVRTEASVRAEHGSMIWNGHGPGPALAHAAPPSPPRVLARTTVVATPTGTADKPMATWEDWTTPETFQFKGTWDGRFDPNGYVVGAHYQGQRWNLYTYGVDGLIGDGNAWQGQAWVERGRLHTIVPDGGQGLFGVSMVTPTAPVRIPDSGYLHVTYEVQPNPSFRRYPWFSMCGSDTAGQTYDENGALRGHLDLGPNFHEPDGKAPFYDGWGCLQMFPYEGGYYDIDASGKPQASIKVLLNRAFTDPYDLDTVVNVAPAQYEWDRGDPNCPTCSWYRTWDASHALTGPMLDDVLRTAPRVRFDLYIKRDRLVVYVDGQPKLCSDFPRTPLTMAEGALGFGQVLYHSAAEYGDFFRKDFPRTAQRYFQTNTPWLDERTWDNLGWGEAAELPAGFDEATCYVSSAQ